MSLAAFLDSKPLYYDEIDYDRMPNAYASISASLKLPKIVHVVGTNGKGTTGRFLANALWRSGYRVGHYTSPHILHFNERIWLNGENVTDETLEHAHQRLLSLLEPRYAEALSYFEYTTLLAIMVYESCDWVILEAGLGGEHDATNVFPKVLSVFTPIDFDHQAFLGDDIEQIASTKLRSMGPEALIGFQPHEEVFTIFEQLCRERGCRGYRIQDILKNSDLQLTESVTLSLDLPEYLQQNLMTAIAAMRVIGITPSSGCFCDLPLFGRLSRLDEKIWIDVGHNALAASAIAKALGDRKVILVYNSYKDKAYGTILRLLKPVVECVEIIEVPEGRIEVREKLEEALKQENICYRDFSSVDASKEYLAFGSFSVVEQFMKVYHA